MKGLLKRTISEQIYTILREDIICQRIKCGEKLTLKILQERFEISSTPVREALNRLSQEGLIDHVTNVGAKVIDLNANDIREIYDFCASLDVTALKMAMCSEKVDEVIAELKQNIEHQEQTLSSESMKEFMVHSDDFHDILFRYADNSRLYSAVLKVRSQFSILTTKYQNFTVTSSMVFKEHKQIANAIAQKDTELATELMTNHFEHAKNYLLKNIEQA